MNALLAVLVLMLAGNDNNVEWSGVSHVATLDRRPLCPVDGEAFAVRIQAYRFDLTGVNVVYDDGAGATVEPAVFIEDRGPYAIWSATVPATAADEVRYYFELIDGTDTDYYAPGGMGESPPGDGGFLIDFLRLTHAPLGATTLSTGGTVFKVWAPNPNNAFVAGPFNGWSTTADRMERDGEYFIGRVGGASAYQPYKYVFKPGPIWKPDARGRRLNPLDSYNSIIEDPFGYSWVSSNFQTPALEDLIVYELHVGTFSGRNDPVASGANPGTYRDVAAHAGNLAELGVNCVEILPITEFPWDFSAGYNPITQWAPESKLGTPDDLKYMVDVLHQHGIAVILDIVWNHFDASDNFLWNYDGGQIYFRTPDFQTPWGSQADFGRGPVRSYFHDSALLWLEEYRIDGFRMDATEYMNIPPFDGDGWSLMQWYNDTLDNRYADRISIAEQLPDDPWVTRPTSLGGAGFDAQWFDAFTDRLREAIFDAAFGDPHMAPLRDVLLGFGPYLSGRTVVNYLEAHDEAWPSSGGQRLVKSIDTTFPHDDMWARGRVTLGQGFVMFAPGIPMILQGSEWLEDTDFGGGTPGGGDRIDWSKRTTYAHVFNYFRDIIAVRKSNGALRANAGIEVNHVNDGGNVIAFHRWDLSGNEIMVVANFSNNDYFDYRLGLPRAGTWYELINNQAAAYGGSGLGNGGSVTTSVGPYDGYDQSALLTIPKMGLLVLRFNHPPGGAACPADLDGDRTISLGDLSIILANFGQAGGPAEGDLDGDGDVDLADLSVMLGMFGSTCPD